MMEVVGCSGNIKPREENSGALIYGVRPAVQLSYPFF